MILSLIWDVLTGMRARLFLSLFLIILLTSLCERDNQLYGSIATYIVPDVGTRVVWAGISWDVGEMYQSRLVIN
jgi:hypothetical protein